MTKEKTTTKIIFDPKSMLGLLKPIKGVVNASGVLPILESALITVKDKWIGFQLTDLESTVTTGMDAETNVGDRTVLFCLDFGDLFKFLTNCEHEPTIWEYNPVNGTLTIKQGGFVLKLQTDDANNFPREPLFDNTKHRMKIPLKEVISTFKKILPFVSHDDLRPAMTGVYVHDDGGQLLAVATDAHMLCKLPITKTPEAMKGLNGIIIPTKPLRIAIECMRGEDIEFMDGTSAKTNGTASEYEINFLRITNGKYTITARLIDARYPDYKTVLVDPETHFYLMRKKFIAFLKLATDFTNRSTSEMRFEVDKDVIKVSGGDVDFAREFSYKLPIFNANKDDISYQFAANAKFLLKALAVSSDEYVKVQTLESSTKAFIFDDSVLIMPLMLNN